MSYADEYDVDIDYNDVSHDVFLMTAADRNGKMKSDELIGAPLEEVDNDKTSSNTTKEVSGSRQGAASISDKLAQIVMGLDLGDCCEEKEEDATDKKKEHATGTEIITDLTKTKAEVIYPEGSREWRKAQRKADKLQRRVQREREDSDLDADDGNKTCDVCTKRVDLLIRCTVDVSRQWKMVCRECWNGVSGGVTDGDAQHPHYTYGGLWKNRRRVK